MEQRYDGSEKIGDIVSEFPGASNMFKEVRIDFCCGGSRTLKEVISERNLDEAELVNRLNEEYERMKLKASGTDINWRDASITDLIDYIVDTHHAYLRKELPLLSEFVTKILRVHGAAHSEIAALHKHFHQMKMELDQHLIAEEEVLFPLLKRYAREQSEELFEQVTKGLRELEADHSIVGDCLKEMRQVTNDYALPPDACRTYTVTYQKLIELESDIVEHVHLENNILFPRIEGQPVWE